MCLIGHLLTRLGMLEMVFARRRPVVAEYYDQRLVDKARGR
ncbi:hypothetical protein ACNKHM_10850 [Shigella sonnei]